MLTSVGCFPTLHLEDFESVPLSAPLHRYTIAHRASLHEGLPDNSIPALKDALAKGVEFLEVDVRQGVDGELFLFHDGSLQKTNYTSPPELLGRSVQKLSTDERRKVRLDAAGTIAIPTLKEALDTISQNRTGTLQIDMKGESDALLNAVIELLKRENKLSRAVIQLRSPERATRIRMLEPLARILARCRNIEQLNQAIAAKVEFVELERWITGEAVEKCHAANITVVLNVAAPQYDNATTWEFFRARGVDAVMTNHAVEAR
jgi:glycerophosphoryl diester phosphodiesterase